MRISGLMKYTLLDYPGHIACTIFFGNCNLRCPFCHNMELVVHPETYPEISIDEILSFLKTRIGKLEGVAITGGEPLLNSDIEDLIKPIKEMGFKIKLDTNGFHPDRLKPLLEKNYLDMIAMDIKSGFTNYLKVAGVPEYADHNWKERIVRSIDMIKNSGIDYEFRTTCVKGLHTKEDFYEIKDMIKGANKYFLQNYKKPPDRDIPEFSSFSKEELEGFLDIVKNAVNAVSIRGL